MVTVNRAVGDGQREDGAWRYAVGLARIASVSQIRPQNKTPQPL